MVRRLLIGLGVATIVFGSMAVLLYVWLVGRPLSAPETRDQVVTDTTFFGDLIPLPATDIHGISRTLKTFAPEETEGARLDPVQQAITRAESHTTPPLKRTLNCLLVGLDQRPGTNYGGRTDTIVIAVLDRSSDHIGLVSIPRDLYVMVPDHGPARINAVWSIAGRQRKNRLALLERVVEDTLAVPIHHALAVDLGVFERSVDALGGVRVHVPCPIQDNFIDERSPTGRRMLDVPAGTVRMNGQTAAMYVRSRHGRSDWDRARRQQRVLYAMREKLLSVGGVGRLPALWDRFGESITTEMSRLDIFRVAVRALQADPRHIHGMVIGYRQTQHWTTPEGRWVLIPDFEAIDEALSGLFSAPSPGTRPTRAVCPASDVAITRPERDKVRRRMRARMRSRTWRPGDPHSSSTDSNSAHSSSSSSSP